MLYKLVFWAYFVFLVQMKHTIEGVIELALEDSDIWVKLVASIIKTYPMTFNLNLDLTSSPIAQHVLQQAAEKGLLLSPLHCVSCTLADVILRSNSKWSYSTIPLTNT